MHSIYLSIYYMCYYVPCLGGKKGKRKKREKIASATVQDAVKSYFFVYKF